MLGLLLAALLLHRLQLLHQLGRLCVDQLNRRYELGDIHLCRLKLDTRIGQNDRPNAVVFAFQLVSQSFVFRDEGVNLLGRLCC